ncbi:MAG: Gfo/Idh/MocA family oxidoreductase [Thermoproteota archaeon]
MDHVRIGFVGCGGIAREHMKGLVKIPGVEIVSFCDERIEVAQEVSREYGSPEAKIFRDAGEMLEKSEMDAVFFCLPPFAHGVELEAIKRGIPFFVEKPVAIRLDQARRIARAVEKKKLLASVGYMNRYRSGVNKVRGLLKDDPPILVLGGWVEGTPSSTKNWVIRKEKSGGQIHNQVTHTIDLARFLCGEISEVHAYCARGKNKHASKDYNVEDASVVNVRFLNGAVGSFWASCSADAGGGGINLSIYANSTTALFTEWEHSLRLLRKGMEPENIPPEEDIFYIEDVVFIEAVRTGDASKIMSPYSDAVKTLRVTLAINESMKLRKPVRITGV